MLTLCGSQALAQTWTLAFTKGPFNWTESCIRQNLAVTLNVYNGGTPQQPLQRWDYVVTDNGYVAPTGSAHFLYAGVANFKLHFPAAIPGVVPGTPPQGWSVILDGPANGVTNNVSWTVNDTPSLALQTYGATWVFSFTTSSPRTAVMTAACPSPPGVAAACGSGLFYCVYAKQMRESIRQSGPLGRPLSRNAAATTADCEALFACGQDSNGGLISPEPTGPAYVPGPQVELTLTQTRLDFRPRASQDDPAADCGNNPYQCKPTFTAKFKDPNVKGTFEFKLALPPWANGWQKGISSNYGDNPTTEPDYKFAAQAGFAAPSGDGLSIQTAQNQNEAKVTVSSLDYGGVANLRVVGTVDGVDYEAALITAEAGVPVTSPGCAGSDHVATLPVDGECNGIADSWEEAHSTVNGSHLAADWDGEPGFGDMPFKGDGYSVRDEYRGFHYVDDNGRTRRWKDTDPVKDVDVFFWDGGGGSTFTTALRAILDPQTNSRFKYRRVLPDQANAADSTRPSDGVYLLNKNSTTLPSTGSNAGGQRGFAVVYAADTLNALNRYAAQTVSLTLGISPQTINGGKAIKIDTRAISRVAMLTGFPEATMIAQVVAHETGHHFGRRHPLRPACCGFVQLANNQLDMLTTASFPCVPRMHGLAMQG